MVGKPEELRLKHNEALKKIPRKYKPYYTEEEREDYEYFEQMSHCDEIDMKGVVLKYDLIQGRCVKEYPLLHRTIVCTNKKHNR